MYQPCGRYDLLLVFEDGETWNAMVELGAALIPTLGGWYLIVDRLQSVPAGTTANFNHGALTNVTTTWAGVENFNVAVVHADPPPSKNVNPLGGELPGGKFNEKV